MKSTHCDTTVPLLWSEEDALQRLRKVLRTSAAGVMRLGLYELLKQYEPDTAKTLVRERLAREVARVSASILFIVGIFGMEAHAALTHQDQPEFRRVRIVRRFGRREEAL